MTTRLVSEHKVHQFITDFHNDDFMFDDQGALFAASVAMRVFEVQGPYIELKDKEWKDLCAIIRKGCKTKNFIKKREASIEFCDKLEAAITKA